MKVVHNFEDYMLDLIVEAILTKDAPLIFSDRFRGLINRIEHPITKKLLNSEHHDGYKNTYIDLDDSGLDKVSFITSTKAIETIANFKKLDKEGEDIEIPKSFFTDTRYNNELKDKLYTKNRATTTIGKLINKLFPKEFIAGGEPGKDIQSFVDKFKSGRDTSDLELVKGDDIVHWYSEDQYLSEDGTLGSSCMRYEDCKSYVEFYADNDKVVSLLILKTENGEGEEKIKGRALVWKLTKPEGRIFMDRIYTNEVYDEELFKSYAKKEGWLHKLRQNSSSGEQIVDTKDGSLNYFNMKVDGVESSSTCDYPYVDTLKYYSDDDGVLANNSDDLGTNYWELSSTEGGYEAREEGTYVEFYGEYINEDDLVWCEMGEEFRTTDDAVWLEFYGESATEQYIERHMVQCDYCDGSGDDAYREESDTVNVYGTDETACSDYAQHNMEYSEYHSDYLPEGKSVWSDHHESNLYEPEAVEVYLNERQSKTDWRAEDDNTWWEWDHDGEKYDNDVTEEELKEYNDIEDEDEE